MADKLQEEIKINIPKIVEELSLSQINALVAKLTEGTTNDSEVFTNILKFVGKQNDASACSCGSGQGICCMDCNH